MGIDGGLQSEMVGKRGGNVFISVVFYVLGVRSRLIILCFMIVFCKGRKKGLTFADKSAPYIYWVGIWG